MQNNARVLIMSITAVFVFLLCTAGTPERADTVKPYLIDAHGAIIRGDQSRKQIAFVLTGDEFADGGQIILKTLGRRGIKASFFLTGNFYSNPRFRNLIRKLKQEGHYLGAHSDKHLLYADWLRRDSLLVTREEFEEDLRANYARMSDFGILREDAPFFLPPYEWYNKTVANWTRNLGFRLVNFTPGTRSHADYTYPGMGDRYVSSDVIYRSIFEYEKKDPSGLNGFMLLIHIGTDPRRKDKFYYKLDGLIAELKRRDYAFVTVKELLTQGEKEKPLHKSDSN